MPIKKRRNLPAKHSNRLPGDAYKTPGVPLQDLVKKHDRLASDKAWEGNVLEADRHQALADQYRERIANGELWETDF